MFEPRVCPSERANRKAQAGSAALADDGMDDAMDEDGSGRVKVR